MRAKGVARQAASIVLTSMLLGSANRREGFGDSNTAFNLRCAGATVVTSVMTQLIAVKSRYAITVA